MCDVQCHVCVLVNNTTNRDKEKGPLSHMELPNLSQLRLKDSVPTSGTGGGPAGGGAAGRDAYGQNDVVEEVLNLLKKREIEAVPEAWRLKGQVRFAITVQQLGPYWSNIFLHFELEFAPNTRKLPSIDTIRDALYEAFSDALSVALQAPLSDEFDEYVRTNVLQISNTPTWNTYHANDPVGDPNVTLYLMRMRVMQDETTMHSILKTLFTGWQEEGSKFKTMYRELLANVFDMLEVTPLPNTVFKHPPLTNLDDYLAMTHEDFEAVRNADIPSLAPDPKDAVDRRSWGLLRELRRRQLAQHREVNE